MRYKKVFTNFYDVCQAGAQVKTDTNTHKNCERWYPTKKQVTTKNEDIEKLNKTKNIRFAEETLYFPFDDVEQRIYF